MLMKIGFGLSVSGYTDIKYRSPLIWGAFKFILQSTRLAPTFTVHAVRMEFMAVPGQHLANHWICSFNILVYSTSRVQSTKIWWNRIR